MTTSNFFRWTVPLKYEKMSSFWIKCQGLSYPKSNLTNFIHQPWFWQRLGLTKHESIIVRAKLYGIFHSAVAWFICRRGCQLWKCPQVSWFLNDWGQDHSEQRNEALKAVKHIAPYPRKHKISVMLHERSTIFPEIIKQYLIFISERKLPLFSLFWPYSLHMSWAEWICRLNQS